MELIFNYNIVENKQQEALVGTLAVPVVPIVPVHNGVQSKRFISFFNLNVDGHQRNSIMLPMIIEKIRKQIRASGKSISQIGRDTGVDKAALSRIMAGGS